MHDIAVARSSIPFVPDRERRIADLRAFETQSEQGHRLRDYWLELSGDRLMPMKRDLDPSRIKAALPYITIHEFIGLEEIRLRLFGTALTQIYNRDLTGENLLDHVNAGGRATAAERIRVAMEKPCGILTRMVGPAGYNQNTLHECYGFPLTDDQGKCRFMIYVIQPVKESVPDYQARVGYKNAQTPTYVDIGAGVPELPEPVRSVTTSASSEGRSRRFG